MSKANISFINSILGLVAAIIILSVIYSDIFVDTKSILLGTAFGFYSIFKWLIYIQIKYAFYPFIIIIGCMFPTIATFHSLMKVSRIYKNPKQSEKNKVYEKTLTVIFIFVAPISFYLANKYTIIDILEIYNTLVNNSVDYIFAPILLFITLVNFIRGFFEKPEYIDKKTWSEPGGKNSITNNKKIWSLPGVHQAKKRGLYNQQDHIREILWVLLYLCILIYSFYHISLSVGYLTTFCVTALTLLILVLAKRSPMTIIKPVLFVGLIVVSSYALEMAKKAKINIEKLDQKESSYSIRTCKNTKSQHMITHQCNIESMITAL